ncbi:MAG TPA: glycoside hydrolase family 3 N-terminal domain-containing protein [Solirubrobacteraceae bacterium]|jgi:beta-N-acetylhexosaminidase|nr:glycoside hydrolase family 3 N-terminal domain-containing protein [Solirubrobacteraceae bacterium]
MLSQLLAAILAAGSAGAPAVQRAAESLRASAPPPRAAADSPTLRQLVGQHMVFAYDGPQPPPALRRRIARGEAAGVILFARNVRSPAQVAAVVRGLQAIERPAGLRAPLLVMADQEGGPVRRIPGAPARAAADVPDAAQARADGLAAARTLRGAGVNMDLAPVADVARAGAALEGERRVYGRSAQRVAALAGAFTAGLHAGGVRATAKHFPGFGAASVNTDAAPARIDEPLATLRAVDASPFAALIAAGVDAVMVSTAIYPALDARPAAFSARWAGDELRGRLGFEGVAITDDLGTPAVRAFGSNARRAVLAARAGIDLPLFSSTYRDGARAAEGLLAAARRGELSHDLLRAQAERVLALRAKLPR